MMAHVAVGRSGRVMCVELCLVVRPSPVCKHSARGWLTRAHDCSDCADGHGASEPSDPPKHVRSPIHLRTCDEFSFVLMLWRPDFCMCVKRGCTPSRARSIGPAISQPFGVQVDLQFSNGTEEVRVLSGFCFTTTLGRSVTRPTGESAMLRRWPSPLGPPTGDMPARLSATARLPEPNST